MIIKQKERLKPLNYLLLLKPRLDKPKEINKKMEKWKLKSNNLNKPKRLKKSNKSLKK
jgi:hypothetical protein